VYVVVYISCFLNNSNAIFTSENLYSYYTCNNTQIVQPHGGVTVVNTGVAAALTTRLATQQMDAQMGVRRALSMHHSVPVVLIIYLFNYVKLHARELPS